MTSLATFELKLIYTSYVNIIHVIVVTRLITIFDAVDYDVVCWICVVTADVDVFGVLNLNRAVVVADDVDVFVVADNVDGPAAVEGSVLLLLLGRGCIFSSDS